MALSQYNKAMRIRLWWLLPLIGVFLFVGLVFTPSHAQENEHFFSQTGHSIRGEFLVFYLSYPEATLLYGFPITDDFVDNMGKEVQYFQRARFEIDPTAPPGKRVKLTDVGTLVFQANRVTPVLDMPTSTPACARYGDFYICNAFLDFFKKHGGVEQFGNPISNYSKEGLQYVQYFERARFVYRPELPSLGYVQLTDLGSIQFGVSANDPKRLYPSPGGDVLSIKASAFVKRALVRSNDEQALYVVVVDQLNRPISNANVNLVIHQPGNNKDIRYGMSATNSDGVSKLIFNVGDMLPNQIYTIEVAVSNQGFKANATTWYRSWW